MKCSGGLPCKRCRDSRGAQPCRYPIRARTVIVPEVYAIILWRLLVQPENRANKSSRLSQQFDGDRPNSPHIPSQPPSPASCQSRNSLTSDPWARRDSGNGIQYHSKSVFEGRVSQQQHVGESTCAAFSDRLLQCLQPLGGTTVSTEYRYVQHPALARQCGSLDTCQFPDKMAATLLVRVALRFIGQDYHFFQHQDFLQQIERAYNPANAWRYDSAWACKFFVVLALGALYSTAISPPDKLSGQSVPGTDYFISAATLLQDLYEEPTVSQVEILLLFVSRIVV